MKNVKKNVNYIYAEYLYILGIALFLFSRLYRYSLIIDISGITTSIIRLISFSFMIPNVVFNNYNRKEIYLIVFLYFLSIICILFGGDKSLILYPTILCGFKNVNIKRTINILFILTLSCLLLHLFVFIIDYVTKNKEFFSMFHFTGRYNEVGVFEKNTIMFADNNMFGIRTVCCVMEYMYLTNRNNHRYFKALILFVLSIVLLLITQSRTSFIMSILLVSYMVIENIHVFNKNVVLIRNISIIGSVSSSILLTNIVLWNNSISIRIDSLLSGRPSVFNKVYNYLGINILPKISKFNSMSKVFGTYMLPDNSYISVFFKWGLAISILIFILTYIFINSNKNEIIIDYFISILAIWFIIEFISMEVVMYFVPLIIMSNYFNKEKK